MPAPLTPTPASLGLASPAIGPWFAAPTPLLAPDADLSISLSLTGNVYPPAGGLRSLFLTGATVPPGLAMLRNAQGDAAFAEAGKFVMLFRLLPEVEERLDTLMKGLPLVSGGAAPTPPVRARPRVRWFALSQAAPSVSDIVTQADPALRDLLGGSLLTNDDDYSAALGLGDKPMADLKRPGVRSSQTGDSRDVLLDFATTIAVQLWTFDSRGRPIDPGAVAAWWNYLATQLYNISGATGSTTPDHLVDPTWLWAPHLPPAEQRTQPIADGTLYTIHLVNPHEGPIPTTPAPGLLSQVVVDNGALVADSTVLYTRSVPAMSMAPTPVTVHVNAPASQLPADPSPPPMVALLPGGTYGPSATLWPNLIPNLSRDFARVAVVDVEQHLLGLQPLTSDSTEIKDQLRASTRLRVARSSGAGPVLLTTCEETTLNFLSVFDHRADLLSIARLVTPTLDRTWGPLSFDLGTYGIDQSSVALPDLLAPPRELSKNFTVDQNLAADATYAGFALDGGGVQTGTHADAVAIGQRVLVIVRPGVALAGAWVRVWPEGFDDQIGEHVRMDGGGGRVQADGNAYAVVTLPDGPVLNDVPIGFNLLLVARSGARLASRIYADVRLKRPLPSTAPAPSALTDVFLCETGEHPGAPPATFPPGVTILNRVSATEWQLVDPNSLSPSQIPQSVIGKLQPQDLVELTEPAFHGFEAGDGSDPRPALTAGLASPPAIDWVERNGLSAILYPSAPFPTLDRLEVACARWSATEAEAALGSAPTRALVHEILPHELGHPGAPGAAETHGTGVRLSGPAALLIAEHVRDRTAGVGLARNVPAPAGELVARSTALLIVEAATPLPTIAAPTTPGVWAAALRTVAAALEGETGLAALFDATAPVINEPLYPLGERLPQLDRWLQSSDPIPTALTAGINYLTNHNLLPPPNVRQAAEVSIARAVDRRVQANRGGLREAAMSLDAAMQRAEDLVYIETPWVDALPVGPADHVFNPWQQLITRMGDRRGLRVIVCVPTHLPHGFPKKLEDVRNTKLLAAIDALRAVDAARVAVFAPGAGTGRSLRLASTSVVIDDCYALTGTTHLSRRGLSFDSSLAAAIFDERLTEGRPTEVRDFRRKLVAARLGIQLRLLPDDPADLVDAIRVLVQRGSARLAATSIALPDPPIGNSDPTILDPDGSVNPLDLIGMFGRLFAGTRGSGSTPNSGGALTDRPTP